jgi:hypothetical protein
MRNLAVHRDSRCEARSPVAVIDLNNMARIVSSHATEAEAERAKAALEFDRHRHFGDAALRRFPLDSNHALESLAAINAREHSTQYTPAEWHEMADAVRSAVIRAYGIVPELREDDEPDDQPDSDIDDDNEDDDEPTSYEFDPDTFIPDPRDFVDQAAYSLPYQTLLSNRPAGGQLEQRRSDNTWWPPPAHHQWVI